MPKQKKQSLLWRATKASFIGLAKATGFVAKSTYRALKKQSNPIYSKQPEIEQLQIVKKITGDYELTNSRLNEDSVIALVFGKRGSGKTSLGFRLLENIHCKTHRKCYVLGVEEQLLPKWIKSISSMEEVPNNSIILVDEGAIAFGSRDSMASKNKELSSLLAIARHKNLSVIFITQNTGMIDKNILKLADILLIKEGSLLQLEMERNEIKKFYEKAKSAFESLDSDRRKYAYVLDGDFEGVISHSLPSFWSMNLSKNQK